MPEPSQAAWNVTELLDRVDNDKELLRELLAIFKEDFPRTMKSLESALIRNDMKSAASLSHALNGMLSNLGGAAAADAAAQLERCCASGNIAATGAAWNRLQNQATALLRDLDALSCLGAEMKILIADDEALSRRLLEKTLDRAGYEVVTEEDGKGAEVDVALYEAKSAGRDCLKFAQPGSTFEVLQSELQQHAQKKR